MRFNLCRCTEVKSHLVLICLSKNTFGYNSTKVIIYYHEFINKSMFCIGATEENVLKFFIYIIENQESGFSIIPEPQISRQIIIY